MMKHSRLLMFALLAMLSFTASACVHEERVTTAAVPAVGVTDATAISGFH